jgi:Rha family phage regulatory protein
MNDAATAMPNICLPEGAVFLKDGCPVTTSLKVAEIFGKRHKDVLRAIREIDCPEEFWRRNFAPRDYVDSRGKTQSMYEMTKDGFMFLVMGFTGAEASAFKIAFIWRFNQMERIIRLGFTRSRNQYENYWFARRPLWPTIRARVLAGQAYGRIAQVLYLSSRRVARAVKTMIRVGLLDPSMVAEAQKGPARRAALRYAEGWGQQMLPRYV